MLGRLMEAEIREQVRVLAVNADEYHRVMVRFAGSDVFEMVVLVARGSSDHAALYARYLIEIHTGLPVSLAAPSVLTRYGRRVDYKKALAVGISQSGAAPDVADFLAMMRVEGHTPIGVTNTPGSRLTKEAPLSLLLNAGEEKSVAATKTYTASLLAMYQLARALYGGLPATDSFLPDDNWIDLCDAEAHRVAPNVVNADVVFCLARGYSFCSAQETALKLMDCALIAAKAYSTADFEHGPKALAGPGSVAIVYGEDVQGLRDQGCQIIQARPVPAHIPENLRPIWEAIFGQLLALHAARLRGKDPDHPQFLQKVTETH